MSFTNGQLFGAVLGAVALFVFPPAALVAAGWSTGSLIALGASVGMTVGGIIDPPDGQTIVQEGPRLGDLNVQTSDWGSPIRRLFGKYKLSGNVIWALKLHETKHVEESGEGKGGGGTKTETIWYSYAGSWAVGLCEGPAVGITKIWFDSVLVFDGTNYAGGLLSDNHEIHLGTATQSADWYIESHNPDTPAYRNLVYIVFNNVELENYGNKLPKVSCEIENSVTNLSDLTDELLLRANLTAAEFDTSEGVSQLIQGYVIPNPMQTRAAITSVTSAYQYELIESDFKIKLKKRNPVPVGSPIEDVVKSVEVERMQTVELSKQVNISYANKDKNYDSGIQSTQRIDSDVVAVKSYQFALVLSDDEAKQIAEWFLYSEWTERSRFEFVLSLEHLSLEPSDVIVILDADDNEFTVRLTQIDFSANQELHCKAVLDDATIYLSNSIGSDTGSAENEVVLQGATTMELLDIPMLDNAYNAEGIYVAADGELDGWKGCGVHKSIDNEMTYNSIGVIVSEQVIGVTTTALPSGPTHFYDLDSTVTVSVVGELYDVSLEGLLNAQNYIVIGDEVLQYQYAIDNGNGTYTLSSLLRGRRGTEWAVGGHVSGERFVLLNNGMIFDATAILGVSSYYKGTTFGDFIEDSISQLIVPEIRCLKPFTPSYIDGVRDGSNNLTITWMRRSRDVTGYFKTLQLYEETERYEIEILDADVATSYFVDDIQEFVYSNAQQLADNSSHVSGDPVEIIIYQISGVVGRGYGSQEIV